MQLSQKLSRELITSTEFLHLLTSNNKEIHQEYDENYLRSQESIVILIKKKINIFNPKIYFIFEFKIYQHSVDFVKEKYLKC